LHWCCESFPFNGLCVCREYTFYWYIDCENFFTIIHWFSLLIERPSYYIPSPNINDFESFFTGTLCRQTVHWNWTTLVWYSLVLEFKLIKLNLFSYHSCCLSYAQSLMVHISARLWLSAHKTLVYSIRVLQGSVATHLRCGEIFNDSFITNCPGVCQ